MSKFLLWIGAGNAQSPELNFSEYDKVILVDPLLPENLLEASDNTNKIFALRKGVIKKDVKFQAFNVFNNDEFSSFLEPVDLKELYPNLTVDEVRDVETVTIIHLIREYNFTGNDNTLVLDIPCLSGDILGELKRNNALNLFNSIIVSAGEKALYLNSNNIQTVSNLLNNEYYEFVEELSDDVDVCTRRFNFNSTLQTVDLLKNEVLDLNAQIKLIANEHKETESEKKELKTLLVNSQLAFSEIQAQLKETQINADEYANQLIILERDKESLESQIFEKNKNIESQNAHIKQTEQQLHAEQDKTSALESEIEGSKKREAANCEKIASLELALQNANENVAGHESQVNALRQEKDNLALQIQEASKQVEEHKAHIKQTEQQLHAEQDKTSALELEIEGSKKREAANCEKIASLELALQNANENVAGHESQVNALRQEKDNLTLQIQEASKQVEEHKAHIEQIEQQLHAEQEKTSALELEIEGSKKREAANCEKIASLELALQNANENVAGHESQINALRQEKDNLTLQIQEASKQVEEHKAHIKQTEQQLHAEQEKTSALESEIEGSKKREAVNCEKIASLELALQNANEQASQQIQVLSKDNDRLCAELQAEQSRVSNVQKNYDDVLASERNLKSSIGELELRIKQSAEIHANEIEDLKAKLKESDDKQKETYGWFASRKQQVEALTTELEALKRENTLLTANNETALAVNELEQKLTAMLNKQNDDSIEIANALGKHVTRCHEEQKSNIASQFELRKLSAFSRLPLAGNTYSMDASNLAELSSLVTHNNYDVIVEFGSGLSTVVAASALLDKRGESSSISNQLLDKNDVSDIENSLPRYIISFEQSSEYLEKTATLLGSAGVAAYVDLCHAPMISAPSFDNFSNGNLFYDCSEKLLELKRVLNARSANILVIVDGPNCETEGESSKHCVLPLVLDYLSQSTLTFFLNNTLSKDGDLCIKWKDECNRRQLSLNIEQLATPKGVVLFNIQP